MKWGLPCHLLIPPPKPLVTAMNCIYTYIYFLSMHKYTVIFIIILKLLVGQKYDKKHKIPLSNLQPRLASNVSDA